MEFYCGDIHHQDVHRALADVLGPEAGLQVHAYGDGTHDIHVWHVDRPDARHVVTVKEEIEQVAVIAPDWDFVDSVEEAVEYLRMRLLVDPTWSPHLEPRPLFAGLRRWFSGRAGR